MSAFDPKLFGQMTFEGNNSTESVPFPVGEWDGMVESVELAAWQKKDDPSKGGLKMLAKISCEDPKVAEVTGRAKNVLTYECMLDLTEDGSSLDFGKGMNVRLGQFREAIGRNRPGEAWTFDQFAGNPIRFKVKHDPYEGRLIPKISEVVFKK
jgi:hypothetical protein